jgi:hypothetical protein
MATGLSKQSELPPSACSVELPSKDHIPTSSNAPGEVVFAHLGLAAQTLRGLKSVQPNVFQF